MGMKTIMFCDLCGCEKGVNTSTVVYGWESCPAGGRSEDVEARADLCPKCKDNLEWTASSIGKAAGVGTEEARGKIALAALYKVASEGVFLRAAKAKAKAKEGE